VEGEVGGVSGGRDLEGQAAQGDEFGGRWCYCNVEVEFVAVVGIRDVVVAAVIVVAAIVVAVSATAASDDGGRRSTQLLLFRRSNILRWCDLEGMG